LKPLKPIILLAFAAALVFAAYSLLFPPAEKVIKKRLQKLAAAVSANPNGNIARVANVNRIGGFFHPNVKVSLQGFGREVSAIDGRGELEQMAMAARQNVGRISAQFYNLEVQLGTSPELAVATMTALVKINDQSDPVVQDLRLEMEKLDGAWLIRSVTPFAR
jgi:hypothetical protein